MTPEEAFIITQYQDVPGNREEQEQLIASMYRKIHGRKLEEMDEKQICAIARDIYARAQKKWKQFMHESRMEEVREDNYEFLYEIFNIPQSQRKHIDPSDLERQLLD